MLTTLKSMLRDDAGQTMAEYGLLIALIALVVIVAATVLGTNLSTLFSKVAQTV
jgi:pilus assembly protein Flp/PilA